VDTILADWRRICKNMSIRTFVAPDSVIKKQIHDHAKGAAAWLAKLEMFAVCYDNLVLRGLVETEFRPIGEESART
jgi:hypothetical protein